MPDMRKVPWVLERAQAVRDRAGEVFAERDAQAFSRFMVWMYADLDRLIRELRDNYPPPEELACAKGCWYCCHSRVSASMPEVVHLAAMLRGQWSEESRGWVAEQSARRVQVGACPADVWRSGLACPLLEGGVCQAYEARPLACRGANSLDMEPCREALVRGEPETLIQRYAPQARAAEMYRRALMDAARSTGLDPACGSLADGLHRFMAIDRPDQAWLSGDMALSL